MGAFSYDLVLEQFQLETLARHLQQTLNLWFDGKSHRFMQANFFRIDPESNYDPAPAPSTFRELVAQVRDDGGRVRVARLDPPDAAVVSTMVAQTSIRLENEGTAGQSLGETLTQLRLAFDRYFRVPEAEQDRLALIHAPGAERERQLAAERSRQAGAARRKAVRVLETSPPSDDDNRRGWRRS